MRADAAGHGSAIVGRDGQCDVAEFSTTTGLAFCESAGGSGRVSRRVWVFVSGLCAELPTLFKPTDQCVHVSIWFARSICLHLMRTTHPACTTRSSHTTIVLSTQHSPPSCTAPQSPPTTHTHDHHHANQPYIHDTPPQHT